MLCNFRIVMERLNSDAAWQSLSDEGYRFTTCWSDPPVGTSAEGCWPAGRTWTEYERTWTHPSWAFDRALNHHYIAMDQAHQREQALRQELAKKDKKIAQLEKFNRIQTESRDMLRGLHARLERIELEMGLSQVHYGERDLDEVMQRVASDPVLGRKTAHQKN